ncbi:MAG: class I SAM-dependent methyltransferase [Defluviitaleaceae bacterium]|nr:class I SAM-dependent methyltransferase [Defluviitaleaceae bacterium]
MQVEKMYIEADTLSTRINLHEKYSVNKYGFGNWIFDMYDFQPGMTVLEIGCGTASGWRKKNLPEKVEIILSDFSPLMLQKARDSLRGEAVFSFAQLDAQNIPYPNADFDAIIANHMLYHVPDKNKSLSEIRRVLKPGGRFFASTLGENSMKELGDIYQKLEGSATFSYAKNITFTLENGANLLGEFFCTVEKHEYVDSLEVTNIDDLIAYIKSYNDVPDSVEDELYRLVSEGFVGGVSKIRKEQGLFICK